MKKTTNVTITNTYWNQISNIQAYRVEIDDARNLIDVWGNMDPQEFVEPEGRVTMVMDEMVYSGIIDRVIVADDMYENTVYVITRVIVKRKEPVQEEIAFSLLDGGRFDATRFGDFNAHDFENFEQLRASLRDVSLSAGWAQGDQFDAAWSKEVATVESWYDSEIERYNESNDSDDE